MLGKLQFSRRQGRGRAGQGKVDSRVTQATELAGHVLMYK